MTIFNMTNIFYFTLRHPYVLVTIICLNFISTQHIQINETESFGNMTIMADYGSTINLAVSFE